MYIQREGLEKQLARAITRSKHIIVHGESGSGKSWLYKKVLGEENTLFETVNLSTADSKGSIRKEMEDLLGRKGIVVNTGYSEKKEGQLSAYVAKGKIDHTKTYQFKGKDSFELLLENMYKDAGKKQS